MQNHEVLTGTPQLTECGRYKKMSRGGLAGAIVGVVTGFFCWFVLVFMGLPKLLIYISGIWTITPVLRLLGLHGQISVLAPALVVCLVSFTLYGWLLGAAASVLSKGSKRG